MERLLTFIGADDRPVRVREADADAWKAQEQEAGREVRPARAYLDSERNPVHVLEQDAAAFEAQAAAEGRPVEPAHAVLVGEEPILVGTSRRDAFLSDYRSKPEFEPDRAAVRTRMQTEQPAAPEQSVARAAVRGAGEGAVTGVKDVARGVSRAFTDTIPSMLWKSLALASGNKSTAVGRFARDVVDDIEARGEMRTWDDPEIEGWASVGPGAFESITANLVPAVATRGQSAKVMPALYGLSRAYDVYDAAVAAGKNRDQAVTLAAGAAALEGGMEYVSSLFGAGKQAREIGRAVGGRELVRNARTLLRNLMTQAATEAGTEFAQEGGGALLDQAAAGKGLNAAQALKQGAMGAAQGAVAALVQGGPGAVLAGRGKGAAAQSTQGAGAQPAAVPRPAPGAPPATPNPPPATPNPSPAPAPTRAERQADWQKGAAKAAAAVEGVARTPWQAVTPQGGVRIGGGWQVVDADALLTSDRAEYPKPMQPRDRDTASSKEQIMQIALAPDPTRLDRSAETDGGAPIVQPDGLVVSGNGRIMGLRQGYDEGTAGEYRGYVMAVAQNMGVDTSTMNKPVLVRVAEGMDAEQARRVAELSNRSPTLQRTAAELAVSDATALRDAGLLEIYNPDEGGNVRSAGNREFLGRFVEATGDQSLRTKNGDYDPSIDARVRRAVLHALLGDGTEARETSRLLTEDRERLGMQRQVDGVLSGARDLLRVGRSRPAYDLVPALGKALRRVVQYRQDRANGGPKEFGQWAGQPDMFADPESTDALSDMIAVALADAKSVAQVQEMLRAYARLAEQTIPAGENLFDGMPNERRGQLLHRALQKGAANEAGQQGEIQLDTGGAVAPGAQVQSGPAAEAVAPGVPAGGNPGPNAGAVAASAATPAIAQTPATDPVEAAARTALGMEPPAPAGTPATTQTPATAPTPATGADIAAAAKRKARGGAIVLPDSRMMDAIRKPWARFMAMFDPARGVPRPVYEAFTQMRRSLESAALLGRGDRQELIAIMRELEGMHGRDIVRGAVQQLQDGVIDARMFSTIFHLPAGNVAERTLQRIQAANTARETAIAAWPGLTDGMRQTIRDNATYQTRKYLRFILGDDYTPTQDAYRDAVAEIEAGLQDAVDTMARRAGAVRGKRGTVDVVAWLETGNPRLLAGVGTTRRAAAMALRKQYLAVRGVIDGLVLAGDTVTANVNAEAMRKASAGWVDYYLGREKSGAGGRGGVDIGGFQHRFLEGAFRALYGEITDPAVRQQLTAETQAKMLAQMTFFQRVLDEAEGTVWARMPDPAKRMDQKLGDAANPADRIRYGDMAGMFVTPEFKQLIDAERNSGATHKMVNAIWFMPMSFQRAAKLMNPKTIWRNYTTALYGFALGSGDVALPGYWKHFADAHKLAKRYASGDAEAIREMQVLFDTGVFTPGASTGVADLQAALGKASGRVSNNLRKLAEGYAFIDFPTKYAAYMSRRGAGMTHEQAVDHVQRMYQNRDAVPTVFSKLSRLGMADYVNYTADSARIMANQLRWAADSIKRGDPRPLVGFAMSRALWAVASEPVAATLAKSVGYAARKLRGDDEEKKLTETPLTPDHTAAFRTFLPQYDRATPLVVSVSRDRNGRIRHVRYTILGGQSAFPLEDIVLGALQGPPRGVGYLNAVLHGLGQMVNEGMLVDTYLRTLTGEDIAGKRTPTGKGLLDAGKGLLGVLPGTPDPARAQIVQDALVGAALDMLPQYPIGMVKELYAKQQKDAAGQRDVGIFARKMEPADIVARGHRLVRSYNLDREDMNRLVRDQVAPIAEALRSSSMIINAAAGAAVEKGGATQKQKALAENAQTKRVGHMRDLIALTRAATDVAPDWFAPPAMVYVLTKSGVSATDAKLIVIGAGGNLPPEMLRKTPMPNVDILDTAAYQAIIGRDS